MTTIIVSHDSDFLDDVVTDILHMHQKKLENFRARLREIFQPIPQKDK